MKITKSLEKLVSKPIKTFKRKREEKAKDYATMRAVDTVSWWRAHHYRSNDELIEYLSRDMAIKEGITPLAMKKAALPYLLKAVEYHNKAEEEGISKDEEKRYWQLAEKSLQGYYTTVRKLKREYWKDAFVTYVMPAGYMILSAIVWVYAIKTSSGNAAFDKLRNIALAGISLYLGIQSMKATHRLDKWYMEEPECIFSNAGEPFLRD
jgi:hypothetical protein